MILSSIDGQAFSFCERKGITISILMEKKAKVKALLEDPSNQRPCAFRHSK